MDPLPAPTNSEIIVVVDDNPSDLLLAEEAVREAGLAAELLLIRGGAAANSYFESVQAGSTPPPTVILLDINMPGITGFDLLKGLKERSALAEIPVFMLSSSQMERDVDHAHELGAAGYMGKPSRIEEFVGLIRQLGSWLASDSSSSSQRSIAAAPRRRPPHRATSGSAPHGHRARDRSGGDRHR